MSNDLLPKQKLRPSRTTIVLGSVLLSFLIVVLLLPVADPLDPAVSRSTGAANQQLTTGAANQQLKMAVETLNNAIDTSVAISFGLFALLGFCLNLTYKSGNLKTIPSMISLSLFFLSQTLSLFYGYRLRINLIVQLKSGEFSLKELEYLLIYQNVFLLVGVFVLLALVLRLYWTSRSTVEPGKK